MSQLLGRLWRDDQGQDLIEYTLLIMFIAIATLWFVGAGGPAIRGIWSSANSTVNQAYTSTTS